MADPVLGSSSGFRRSLGYRFPIEVIVLVVRWYLRFGLSNLDLDDILAEGGIEVDHVTSYRWVRRLPHFCSTRPGRAGTPSAAAL